MIASLRGFTKGTMHTAMSSSGFTANVTHSLLLSPSVSTNQVVDSKQQHWNQILREP